MAKNIIKNLILTHPLWVKRYLTRQYPLPVELVDRYADGINWDLLSENDKFAFDEDFCAKYEDRINWEIFLPLRSSVFTGKGRDARLISFLDRFSSKMDWFSTSIWLKQPEDPAMLIQRYEDQWDWKGLSYNEGINWTPALFRQFRDKLRWDQISMNALIEWKFEWLVEFEDLLDWDLLYINANYDWNLTSFLRFEHNLNAAGVDIKSTDFLYDREEINNNFFFGNGHMYSNDSEDEIKLREYEYRFEEIQKIIYSNRNKLAEINWEYNIIWTKESFEYILNCKGTDLLHLSTYSRFKDPAAILRKFGSRLIWGEEFWDTVPEDIIEGGGEFMIYKGVSANPNIIWTEELLDEFRDQIDWKVLSKDGHIKWTPEILDKYFDLLDKDVLLEEDILEGENRLFLDLIIPELDDKMIEVLMMYSEGMFS
jgi:hypothetical protein